MVIDIQIKIGNILVQVSSSLIFIVNFDVSDVVIDCIIVLFDVINSSFYIDSYIIMVYDLLGNEYLVCQYFIKISDNIWEVQYIFDGQQQIGVFVIILIFDLNIGKLILLIMLQIIEFQIDVVVFIDLIVDYFICM